MMSEEMEDCVVESGERINGGMALSVIENSTEQVDDLKEEMERQVVEVKEKLRSSLCKLEAKLLNRLGQDPKGYRKAVYVQKPVQYIVAEGNSILKAPSKDYLHPVAATFMFLLAQQLQYFLG